MTTEFWGIFSHSVEFGQAFVIGGKTIDEASRLDISLRSSKKNDASIPLQLSVLFEENIIVRNSCQADGLWLDEEREENLDEFTPTNPLIAGDFFQFYIFVGENKFHIAVNKVPFCTYSFKIPIEEICAIGINKDVQSVLQVDHRQIYPFLHPINQYDEMSIPFSNDVPNKFQAGHIIIITGIPYGNPKGKFIISFTECGKQKEALHYNPRFEPHYCVVRNAMNDNMDFGREERDEIFPYAIDEQFKLAIAMTETEFLFAVNGRKLDSFAYRTQNQLDKLNGFKIFGINGMQLEITSVDHINGSLEECGNYHLYSYLSFEVK